jgi:large-conductance mechanosensitive channel
MKKIEWLIAFFFMGIGVMCMTLSAVSFQSDSLLHFGNMVKTFLICAVLIAVSLFLVLRVLKLNKRSKK